MATQADVWPPHGKIKEEHRSKAEIIEGKLLETIANAEDGARLPSERDMAQEFGVNRATVRSATIRLAAQGMLEIVQGGGTFVRKKERKPQGDELIQELTAISDMELLKELVSRGYRFRTSQIPRWREEAMTLYDTKTNQSRPARVVTLLCPESSPLWWPEDSDAQTRREDDPTRCLESESALGIRD